jgi:glutaconate CoA-transferase subunit B
MAAQQAYPGTDAYSMAELMVCEMARNLAADDGSIGGAGAGAVLAMAANRLATLTVAPNIWWFCGGSGCWNPTFSELPLTSADPRAAAGAEATNTMMQTVDMAMIGNVWGYGFNGGMQVDKHGNCNMIGIGPYENLRVRGPGTVGTLWTSTITKYYLYFWHHNKRVVVDKVDFVSSPGFLDGGESRWRHCRPESKGPALVYTPLCVMDFTPDTRRLRLRSVNPGYAVKDVIENTGCELVLPNRVPETAPPSETELFVLRSQVDRKRVLKDYRLTIG